MARRRGLVGTVRLSITAAAALLVPAAAVPMSPEVRSLVGYDDDVTDARTDLRLTAGTGIRLAGLIRLDRFHGLAVRLERGSTVRVVMRVRRHRGRAYRHDMDTGGTPRWGSVR